MSKAATSTASCRCQTGLSTITAGVRQTSCSHSHSSFGSSRSARVPRFPGVLCDSPRALFPVYSTDGCYVSSPQTRRLRGSRHRRCNRARPRMSATSTVALEKSAVFRRLPVGSGPANRLVARAAATAGRRADGAFRRTLARCRPGQRLARREWGGLGARPLLRRRLVPLAYVLRDRLLFARRRRTDAASSAASEAWPFGPGSNVIGGRGWPGFKVLAQHFEASRMTACSHSWSGISGTSWRSCRGARSTIGLGHARREPPHARLRYLRRRPGGEGAGRRAARRARAQLGRVPGGQPPAWLHARGTPTAGVVNVAMGLGPPAVRHLDGSSGTLVGWTVLDNIGRHHGQVTGMFSGDEWLAGRAPYHGVELCAVAEFMFTRNPGRGHRGRLLRRLAGDYLQRCLPLRSPPTCTH